MAYDGRLTGMISFREVEEGEWDRVKRMRAEGETLGGNYREWIPYMTDLEVSIHREHQRKYQQKKRDLAVAQRGLNECDND